MLNVRNAPTVQRCGPTPCDCSPEERADYEVAHADRPSAQRVGPGDQPVPQAPPCGPGTRNPFCLPIPDSDAPCTPFDSLDHALSVWADLSGRVPAAAAALTVCGEVKEVWDAYFAATSQRFAFTGPSSCVAAGAKKDSAGSATAGKAADDLMKSIVDNLPAMLVGVTPPPFNLGGPLVSCAGNSPTKSGE
jgi:hypothetical protein